MLSIDELHKTNTQRQQIFVQWSASGIIGFHLFEKPQENWRSEWVWSLIEWFLFVKYAFEETSRTSFTLCSWTCLARKGHTNKNVSLGRSEERKAFWVLLIIWWILFFCRLEERTIFFMLSKRNSGQCFRCAGGQEGELSSGRIVPMTCRATQALHVWPNLAPLRPDWPVLCPDFVFDRSGGLKSHLFLDELCCKLLLLVTTWPCCSPMPGQILPCPFCPEFGFFFLHLGHALNDASWQEHFLISQIC